MRFFSGQHGHTCRSSYLGAPSPSEPPGASGPHKTLQFKLVECHRVHSKVIVLNAEDPAVLNVQHPEAGWKGNRSKPIPGRREDLETLGGPRINRVVADPDVSEIITPERTKERKGLPDRPPELGEESVTSLSIDGPAGFFHEVSLVCYPNAICDEPSLPRESQHLGDLASRTHPLHLGSVGTANEDGSTRGFHHPHGGKSNPSASRCALHPVERQQRVETFGREIEPGNDPLEPKLGEVGTMSSAPHNQAALVRSDG